MPIRVDPEAYPHEVELRGTRPRVIGHSHTQTVIDLLAEYGIEARLTETGPSGSRYARLRANLDASRNTQLATSLSERGYRLLWQPAASP